MVVRIRFARFGTRNNPLYNIVVAQGKSGRNKKPMEVLGTYDPVPKDPVPGLYPHSGTSSTSTTSSPQSSAPTATTQDNVSSSSRAPSKRPRRYKDIRLDTARTKYWLGVGAQPTEPVWKLLSLLGLVERRFREDELRVKAREADERHREYWARQGLGPDGVTPLGEVKGARAAAAAAPAVDAVA